MGAEAFWCMPSMWLSRKTCCKFINANEENFAGDVDGAIAA
jgi:hypothetical protein